MELPQRKQLRLRGCQYGFPGVYFVTICSAERRPVFGSVSEGKIVLSRIGEMVRSEWIALTERFPSLVLDEFVIMPNQICTAFWVLWANVGEGLAPPVGAAQTPPLHCLTSLARSNRFLPSR